MVCVRCPALPLHGRDEAAGFRWEDEFGAAIVTLLAFAARIHGSISSIGQDEKVRATLEAGESNATGTHWHVFCRGESLTRGSWD